MDISYTTPHHNVYLGKFNKVKNLAQKRYLLWTIRDIMDIINGSKTVQSDAPSDSFEAKFGKKMTFHQYTICLSVTSSMSLTEKALNGLISVRFVKTPFFLSMG